MSNMTDLWLSGAIFSTPKYSKTRFRRGHPFPLDAFRLRRLDLGAEGASVVRPPQHKFLATPMVWLISLKLPIGLLFEPCSVGVGHSV